MIHLVYINTIIIYDERKKNQHDLGTKACLYIGNKKRNESQLYKRKCSNAKVLLPVMAVQYELYLVKIHPSLFRDPL